MRSLQSAAAALTPLLLPPPLLAPPPVVAVLVAVTALEPSVCAAALVSAPRRRLTTLRAAPPAPAAPRRAYSAETGTSPHPEGRAPGAPGVGSDGWRRRGGKSERGGAKARGRRRRRASESAWLWRVESALRAAPVGGLPAEDLRSAYPAACAWSRRGTAEGAERAYALMKRVSDEVEAGNGAARLNVKMCNAVLSAVARVGSCELATSLLAWMGRAHDPAGGYDTRPNTVSFTTLIDAWAKSGRVDAPDKAEAILRLMESENVGGKGGAGPNVVTYNAVINAWAKSDRMDKAVRAEALVGRMDELCGAGNDRVRPDVFTYQSLISAWSTSKVWGAPQRCEEILRMMDGTHKASIGDASGSVRPNARCFAAAINAWSKSRERRKARSAYRIIQYMTKLYQEGNEDVRPNVVCYTAALNACAFPPPNNDADPEVEEERGECYDIAVLIMEELRASPWVDGPNHLTYATFLDACARTLPAGSTERRAAAWMTAVMCAREGQFGEAVLDRLMRHFPDVGAEWLCGSEVNGDSCDLDGLAAKDLPAEWTRNVRGEKRKRLRRPRGAKDARLAEDSALKLRMVMSKRGMRGFYSKEMGRSKSEINKQEEREVQWMDLVNPLEEYSVLV